MPFQTTTTPPDSQPDVKILFYGMLLLYPENRGCYVGVNNNLTHALYIAVQVEGQPQPIMWLNGHLKKPLTIRITGGPVNGVRKYISSGAQNFENCLDLKKLHPKKTLEINPSYTQPGVYLNEGMLYAGGLTPKYLQVHLQRSRKRRPHGRIGYPIAANISFKGRILEMTWADDGGDHIFTLPREHTTGEKYVILINNGENPVVEPAPPRSAAKPICGDFNNHYLAVDGVDKNEQVNVCFTAVKFVATRVPCMAAVVGG
jgi:hypothetical protein